MLEIQPAAMPSPDIDAFQKQLEAKIVSRARRLTGNLRLPSSYIFPSAVRQLTTLTDQIKRALTANLPDGDIASLLEQLTALKTTWQRVNLVNPQEIETADKEPYRKLYGDYANLAPVTLAHIENLLNFLTQFQPNSG